MQPLHHLFSKYFICYALFFLLTYITKLNDGLKLMDEKGPVRNPGTLIGLHIAGILWLGLIPINILENSFLKIVFGNTYPDLAQWTVFVLSLLMSFFITYSQAAMFLHRFAFWQQATFFNSAFLYKYFALRVIFLVFYETWFRGYLLSDTIAYAGIPIAIVLNTFLYTLLHIFGSKKEMLACIPFGVLMCSLCIWLGAAWPAIVLHCSIALTYEVGLVKRVYKPIRSIR